MIKPETRIFRHIMIGLMCWLSLPAILFSGDFPPEVLHRSLSAPTAEQFIDSLLALMTLEDKLGQLTQYRWPWGERNETQREIYRSEIKKGRVGSFLGISGVENSRELQRLAVEESRLGIPLLFAHDVIHGYRTIFPVPLAEASSWDPPAVERSARIAATEAAAAGLHWTFAPMVDITREPRWGRVVEGAGEDPFLGAAMAAARVRGFQGNDLAASHTLLACAKHFAAYGGAEGGRDYNTVDISQRTLREIYLPPFQAAVDAGVATLMGAFNEIGGIPMHANRYLLSEILRNEWGFEGLVVSDFTAIRELQAHGIAATPAEAGKIALGAGVDVDMMSGIYINELQSVVREGQLPAEIVDRAVRRVLRAKYQAGLFDDPFRYHDSAREKKNLLTPEHLLAAREMARKSIVLLKNEGNLLPLSEGIQTLAVIGALADDRDAPLGSWRAVGRAEDTVSLLQGIRQMVSSGTVVQFAKGYQTPASDDTSGLAQAVEIARKAEAVVLVIGESPRMSGEASNRSTLDLPGVQEALVREIHGTGTPVVVVLMNGRPLSINWLAEHIPAILETWFPGVQGGPAVAEVLFGVVNPGGKLPITFPRSVGQVPIYYNHKNTGRPPREEDYYTSKYLDLPSTPLYPFGYGLSYSTFSYEIPQLNVSKIRASDTLQIAVAVTNNSKRPGDEVVQCYLQDEVGSVTRPVKQLRGFRRIHLQPGETQTVYFTLTFEDLAFYNLKMKQVVEPGTFKVFIGGNSVDVREAGFEVIE